MDFTPFKQSVFDHLTVDGHPERTKCLRDLIVRGVFRETNPDEAVKVIIEAYLRNNPRGFCKDGIDRFTDAIGLTPKPKKFRVTFDVEVENVPSHWGEPTIAGVGDSYGLGTAMATHLLAKKTFGQMKVTTMVEVDHETDPSKITCRSWR